MYHVVATTSLRSIAVQTINLLRQTSSGDYKRTWQEVSNVLLPYLYNRYMVYANNE